MDEGGGRNINFIPFHFTSISKMVDSENIDQNEVMRRYQQMENECRQFVTKISELEVRL